MVTMHDFGLEGEFDPRRDHAYFQLFFLYNVLLYIIQIPQKRNSTYMKEQCSMRATTN